MRAPVGASGVAVAASALAVHALSFAAPPSSRARPRWRHRGGGRGARPRAVRAPAGAAGVMVAALFLAAHALSLAARAQVGTAGGGGLGSLPRHISRRQGVTVACYLI